MSKVTECKFEQAWIGKCKNKSDESGFCDKHKLKCSSCGAVANHDCEATIGLVCGAPLCADCEHTTNSNGCSSGGELPKGYKSHCKIKDQEFQPWYMKEVKK